MSINMLNTVERKVFGAILAFTNDDGVAVLSRTEIAKWIGYATSGGAITNALRFLELHNYILIDGRIGTQIKVRVLL